MPSFAGARAKLATATQDLFRLSGNHALPVEVVSEPPKPSVPEPMSSTRKPEASMMFSLEALMKATQHTPKPEVDEASDQLWSMQAATPLFGTAHDQALLTTPLKMEPAQSMDSMTLPSQPPNGRRWWPIVLAAGAGLSLAGAGIWLFGISNGTSPLDSHLAAATPPALVAQPLAEPNLAEAARAEATDPATPVDAVPSPAEPTLAEPGATPTASDVDPGAAQLAPGASSPVPSGSVSSGSVPPGSVSPGSVSSSSARDAEKNKAGRDKPSKKAAPRVEKPSAPLKLAAVFDFDKAAAKTALNDAARASSTCGAGGEPGKGKIQVTFAPTGKVADAQLVEGPFAGTSAGKCAVRLFKAAKVPAFSGAPVTVAKSFKID